MCSKAMLCDYSQVYGGPVNFNDVNYSKLWPAWLSTRLRRMCASSLLLREGEATRGAKRVPRREWEGPARAPRGPSRPPPHHGGLLPGYSASSFRRGDPRFPRGARPAPRRRSVCLPVCCSPTPSPSRALQEKGGAAPTARWGAVEGRPRAQAQL